MDSTAYDYDRDSASYSRDALEDLLRSLSKYRQVGEVSVLAHSMGNWVTLEALRQMAIRDGKVTDKIRNVLLAAPDVDVDVVREEIVAMGSQRPNFTLFASESKVWGGPTLGAIDPDVEPYRSALERDRIAVVNLTGLSSPDQLHHGTFAENPQVVELIGRSLASGQTFTGRLGGKRIMATTVSAAVGNAASLVVGIWQFLKDTANLAIITAMAAGAWAVITFFAKNREKGSTAPSVKADHGGVAAGRDITGPVNTDTRDDSKG
jgi:esterase/lipase superfamily enzyme